MLKVRLFFARLLTHVGYGILYNMTRLVPKECPRRAYMRGRIEQTRERILPLLQED